MTIKKEDNNTRKKTIISLIGESQYNIPTIIGALADAKILETYNMEKKNEKLGMSLEPKFTTKEFNKIITDYLNKKT